jgi:hypothetical protein
MTPSETSSRKTVFLSIIPISLVFICIHTPLNTNKLFFYELRGKLQYFRKLLKSALLNFLV